MRGYIYKAEIPQGSKEKVVLWLKDVKCCWASTEYSINYLYVTPQGKLFYGEYADTFNETNAEEVGLEEFMAHTEILQLQ